MTLDYRRFGIGVVVLIWSLSPSLVNYFRVLGPPAQLARNSLLVSGCAAALHLLVDRRARASLRGLVQCPLKRILGLLALGALGFGLYTILYFTGIQSDRPLSANLINYLWPVIAFLVTAGLTLTKPTLEECGGIVLAFVGAVVVLALEQQAGQASRDAIAFSLGGALSYGIYTGALRRVGAATEPDSRQRDFILMLVGGLASQWTIWGWIAPAPAAPATPTLPYGPVLALVGYAVLWYVGHYVWYRLQTQAGDHQAVTAVFLVPVLATATLSLSFQSSLALFTALAFVVTGWLLSAHGNLRLPPLAGVVYIVVTGLVLDRALGPWLATASAPRQLAGALGVILQIAVGLIAIVGGFLLTTAVERCRAARLLYADTMKKLFQSLEAAHLRDPETTSLAVALGTWASLGRHLDPLRDDPRRLASFDAELERLPADVRRTIRDQILRGDTTSGFPVSNLEWTFLGLGSAAVFATARVADATPFEHALLHVLVAALGCLLLALREFHMLRPSSLVTFIEVVFATYAPPSTAARCQVPELVLWRASRLPRTQNFDVAAYRPDGFARVQPTMLVKRIRKLSTVHVVAGTALVVSAILYVWYT